MKINIVSLSLLTLSLSSLKAGEDRKHIASSKAIIMLTKDRDASKKDENKAQEVRTRPEWKPIRSETPVIAEQSERIQAHQVLDQQSVLNSRGELEFIKVIYKQDGVEKVKYFSIGHTPEDYVVHTGFGPFPLARQQ